jgi:hypothetical protein
MAERTSNQRVPYSFIISSFYFANEIGKYAITPSLSAFLYSSTGFLYLFGLNQMIISIKEMAAIIHEKIQKYHICSTFFSWKRQLKD